MRKWAKADFPKAERSTFAFQKLNARRAFYWLPVRRMAILRRLQERMRMAGTCVVLDLEDGLWFPENPAKTEACRASAREELRTDADYLRRVSGGIALGIRINPVDTPEFMRDLETLASMHLEWNCIFLPKVESGPGYWRALEALSYSGVSCSELIPIVETRAGMERIRDIAVAAKEAGAACIQYGHQDYSLSSGHWPFWEQDRPQFKALVERIVAVAEDNGLGYIHTPYMHLRDREGFLEVQRWLKRICGLPHAQATLSWEQTSARQHAAAEDQPSWRKGSLSQAPIRQSPGESPTALARQVVDGYLLNLHSGRGFSVDAETGRFFSPHEYRAALRFLAGDSHDPG